MKRNNRKSRSLAADQRKAYWGLTMGFIGAAGVFALIVFGSPVFSLKRMVLAQTVPGTSASGPSASPAPTVRGDLIDTSSSAAPAVTTAKPIATNTTPLAVVAPVALKSAAPDSKTETYEPAGFDRLAGFKFEVTDDIALGTGDAMTASQKISEQIPPAIKALSDKQVAITGFMLPLQVRHGQATAFLILKSQMMCCYGITPKMNEWVLVRTVGKGVKPTMDRPVTVYGIMHVGEIRENKMLAGIYRLDADKMEIP